MTLLPWHNGEDDVAATQRDRDAVTLMAIPYVAGLVTLAYICFALGHVFLLPAELMVPMVAVAAATAMAGSMGLGFWRLGWIKTWQANGVMSGYAMAVFANSALHLLLTQEPRQAVNLGLAFVCIGLFHLSIRHLVANYAIILAASLVIYEQVMTPEEIAHYSFFLLSCSMVMAIAFAIRWRIYSRMIEMNKEATAREAALEEALTRARIAEMSERDAHAKNEFLANMSHELRTPLNAVIGFSEVLKDEMFGPLGKPEYRAYATDIHDSGVKLLGILNDILDLAAISQENLEVDQEEFDLEVVMARCISLASARKGRKNVTVTGTVRPRAETIYSDERRVKQMLIALLSNAIKFTPDGGMVTAEAGVDDERGVYIRVSDTGVGMDDVQLTKALNPFWQAESALNRSYEGVGLGLPLTREFAHRLGGILEIDSAPGRGTQATVWLPFSVLAPRPEARQAAAS